MTTDPIDGTWLPFKAELAGDPAPDLALVKLRLVIRAGTYAVHFGGEITDEGSVSLDRAGDQTTLTLVSVRGANAGRTIPSIYQLTGDRLRICYGLGGKPPAAFVSTRGSEHYLVTYKRQG